MYVYNAELWCDECAEPLREQARAMGGRPEETDSDEWPQYAPEGETDSPSHCASGRDCLDRIDLAEYGCPTDDRNRYVGALIGETLTDQGYSYVGEMLNAPNPSPYQRALHALWRETFDIREPGFVVIEYTPGYLPDDDDPATFEADEYAQAVEYLNERAAEYEEMNADGARYRVEYGIASGDNLAAVIVHDDDKTHDLGRVIEILREEV